MRDRPQHGPPDKKAAAPAVTPGQRPVHRSDSYQQYTTLFRDPENRRLFDRAMAIGRRGWLRPYVPRRPRESRYIGDYVVWLLSIGYGSFPEHVRLVHRAYDRALAAYRARQRRHPTTRRAS